ncbi:hypothetical protein H6S82_00280 [Planktothrix sp. FACHB-1355]|uniref:Nucleotidyl transferase AbiEii/AbiGii toxin family protein n=1 Tax=Aerosakkonema funiforme FACHB-1375 TaxID=2949571 RepID=A0A926VDL9_9CYAN|nr:MULTISPECIES: hypothetical protein [Oscillatoriales]MBD2181888.1 hypothetical protein [Aerosakkonema funiforme FACHB-1375]MBD3557308.1 hypothetical protein [Planktothrix sp. FACHB-1355]
MVAKRDYTQMAVEAARSVLLELVRILGEYRNEIVIIGGWVPELLLSEAQQRHIGSTDVDIALNHRTLQAAGYKTIQELLLARGYREGRQPFIFSRTVTVNDREIVVQVDFLAGEYEGSAKSHRTQEIQDIRARKARGCDLAFELFTEVRISGTLPGGGIDSASLRVASIVPFLVMKGMALYDRLKEKDAWDIYFCLYNYPGGLDALVEEFKPHITRGLVREGLSKIAEKFASPSHIGPVFVSDFEELSDPVEREFLQRDAYERVNYLLTQLGIS